MLDLPDWFTDDVTYAYVGKINVSTAMWSWQKKVTSAQDYTTFNTVSALSVDPSGTKLACHGMKWQFSDKPQNPATKIGYLFVLNASNGAVVSGLLKMSHTSNQLIQSKGFSLHDSGQLFLTIGQQPSSSLQTPHLIVYDSLTNSVIKQHRGLSGYSYGVTASLVQGDPAFDDYLYIGGQIAKTSNESHLAIFRYDYATSETLLNAIFYENGCSGVNLDQ